MQKLKVTALIVSALWLQHFAQLLGYSALPLVIGTVYLWYLLGLTYSRSEGALISPPSFKTLQELYSPCQLEGHFLLVSTNEEGKRVKHCTRCDIIFHNGRISQPAKHYDFKEERYLAR